MGSGVRTQPAVTCFAPERYSVEIREIGLPEIGEDEVLLEVVNIGVCGSDLHMWLGDQSWKVPYPLVLGHEFSGIIRETGTRVSPAWKTGDRVVSETAAVVDPNSPMTRRGLYNLDPGRKGFGGAVDGSMTRLVAVPERILHRVPERVSMQEAALTEPCCVAYNAAVKNADIEPGDRVLVLGPGPIGILCAIMARMQGAIVAVAGLERDRKRLEIARQYDCETLTNDIESWAFDSGPDRLGVEGVIDTTGVSASLETAMKVVRPAGWISKVGWGPQPNNFSLDPIVQKNIRLQGSFSHNWPMWERVLQLMSCGRLDVKPIIGGIWPLESWDEAFRTMHSGDIVKSVLKAN
ncbi:MAG: zinc-binding dehydrogenase [Planctomyces sp.]|nr:zinc-binding dehydrogenase [Planctomyces sp.]